MMNPMQMIGNMGGNPMAMLMQMAMGGGSPQQMILRMMEQNPQMRQYLPLIQGKTPQQLEQTARNLCKQQGVEPEQVIQRLRQMVPPK